MGARAVLVEVATRHADEKYTRGRHWEIVWQGVAGEVRSGQWYETVLAAQRMALDCGAAEIEEAGTLVT